VSWYRAERIGIAQSRCHLCTTVPCAICNTSDPLRWGGTARALKPRLASPANTLNPRHYRQGQTHTRTAANDVAASGWLCVAPMLKKNMQG
jgi:hypothetical protein